MCFQQKDAVHIFFKEAFLVPYYSVGGLPGAKQTVFWGVNLPEVTASAPVKYYVSYSCFIIWNYLEYTEVGARAAHQLCGSSYFTEFT